MYLFMHNMLTNVMVLFSIGRSSGFKSAELQNLVDGSTLFVGNKEVEV